MAKTTGQELGTIIGAAIVGIVGGLVVIAILDSIFSPKCPVCKQTIPKGANPCPNCYTSLRWG